MTRAKAFVGTSGWSYSHWKNGRFYPPGLPQSRWLAFFAEHFQTVELNASFYRLPTSEMVQAWHNTVADDFLFAVKMWKHITHTKKLNDCREKLDIFFDVVNHFGGKTGPMLVQLPPKFNKNIPRLDSFLTDLNEVKARPWRVAVEFRNTTWLTDDVIEILNRHGAALVLQDMPYAKTETPNDANFIYIRRHGHSGGYGGCYTDEEIENDAAQIKKWIKAGRDVYIYYNNDQGGYAIDNGKKLKELLSTYQ